MCDELFDFSVELAKLINPGQDMSGSANDDSDSDDSGSDDSDSDYCLISGEKLTDTCVKLLCKHSFNYEPLFNEVKKL